jgi:hypothetical protein
MQGQEEWKMKTKDLKKNSKKFKKKNYFVIVLKLSISYVSKKIWCKKKKAMTFTKSHYIAHLKGNPRQVKVKELEKNS